MANPGLSHCLSLAVTEATLATATSDIETWRSLQGLLTEASAACESHPTLRRFLQELQRETAALADGSPEAVAPEILLDAILAALEWAEGRDPGALDLNASIAAVMQRSGASSAMQARVLEKIQAEATQIVRMESTATDPDAIRDVATAAPLAIGTVVDDATPMLAPEEHARVAGERESAQQAPQNAAEGTIWLAPEELEMLSKSIHEELLPKLGDWVALPTPRPIDNTLSFLLEAQRNALDVLGLRALANLLQQVETALWAASDGGACADALAQWFAALTVSLSDPGSMADVLRDASATLHHIIGLTEPPTAIETELARVRIGIDPSWLNRPRRTLEEGDLDLRPAEDVIPSVLQGMLRELPQHTASLSDALVRLRMRQDREDLNVARRITHTLKGDANTVGVRGIAKLAHAMEDILVELGRRETEWPSAISEVLERAGDCLAAMADHLLGRGPVPPDAAEVLSEVYATADELERGEKLADDETQAVSSAVEPLPKRDAPTGPSEAPRPAASDDTITLPRSVLDRLLRLSAESFALATQLRAQTARQESCRANLAQDLTALRLAALQLDEQVSFRGMALAEQRQREGQVDELELDRYNELYMASRRIQETEADVRSRLDELERVDAQLESLIQRKSRLDEDLQSAVRAARLVPVNEHRPRFERTVRQTARMLGKSVEIDVQGTDLRVDKVVLDALVDPLMHLLRNAVDHGIEAPERRLDAGKPAHGQLRLAFAIDGQNLRVELTDDGAGIDFEQVRRKGLREGWIAADADTRTLTELLFRPGFSSREQVTQVSGRGVGLDVVARELRQIGGAVRVDSEPGRGTRFTMHVPLALGALQVALVEVHQHIYALATDGFRSFERLAAEDFQRTDGLAQARFDDTWLPVFDLGALLGQAPMSWPPASDTVAVVEDEFGARQLVAIAGVSGLSLVVLESTPAWLPSLPGVRGACILGDGRAAPVLNLRELCRTRDTRPQPEWASLPQRQAPLVVVADDSLTIRRALGELLADAGFRVLGAEDGLEALLLLQRHECAALLVDLEMPRMNGLELTQHLRQSTTHAKLPVVMITSRSSVRHRELALAAGVNEVLTKPYSDDQVLTALAQLIQ